jgi:hypothetical protein
MARAAPALGGGRFVLWVRSRDLDSIAGAALQVLCKIDSWAFCRILRLGCDKAGADRYINQRLFFEVRGGNLSVDLLEVHELRSIWETSGAVANPAVDRLDTRSSQ